MSSINPIAIDLNNAIQENSHHIIDMLSDFGRQIYFPKGILSQGAEAKQQAHRTNATIGVALERGEPMHLPSIHRYIDHISPNDSYLYAPASGKPELREAWREKIMGEGYERMMPRHGRPQHGRRSLTDVALRVATPVAWALAPLRFVAERVLEPVARGVGRAAVGTVRLARTVQGYIPTSLKIALGVGANTAGTTWPCCASSDSTCANTVCTISLVSMAS